MLAPLSWLRDFADFTQPTDEIAEALSNLGLVVEAVSEIGKGLNGVEVVSIRAIRNHPNAERIRLVDVDRGDGIELQIACGAKNMAVGDLVALATLGTVLPDGTEIARRKMRGEWSNGMLCSAVELAMPDDGVDGLMILPAGLAPEGTPLATALSIQSDVVFDLDITPNRPDCLSMAGIARDLAAGLGIKFVLAATPDEIDPSIAPARVAIGDPALCGRLTGTVIEGVEVGPSPAWLVSRLALAGMRSINNVVDASNYVMLHLGQPNHAYDLDRLGGGGLEARAGRVGESLTTLDGVKRDVGSEDCVISDLAGHAVGVGGIMGGKSSEISPTTTTVLLEAAYFSPMAIARAGKRLGLRSEARSRFERGVDPEIAPAAVDLFVSVLGATTVGDGPRRGPTTDVRAASAAPTVITLRPARVGAILGADLDLREIEDYLRRLGFGLGPAGVGGPGVGGPGVGGRGVGGPDAAAPNMAALGDGSLDVTVPSWRPDITREIDLIEEVARLYGYRNIERTLPGGARRSAGLTAYQRKRRRIREILAGTGLDEAWTTTFLAPGDLGRAGLASDAVEVENPLDQSESVLRTSLLPGLLKAARFNADRQQADVRLFEIGRSFALPSGDAVTPDETERLAVLLSGGGADGRLAARIWAVLALALRLAKTDLEAAEIPGVHPSRGAWIIGQGGKVLGAVGEVDPEVSSAYGLSGRVGWLEVDLEALIAEPTIPKQARVVSRFPASDVDLAFVVSDVVSAAAMQRTLLDSGAGLVESVDLFDVYRSAEMGDDRRSLAFRLRLRAPDRTLTDEELARHRLGAIDAVASGHGAQLRT